MRGKIAVAACGGLLVAGVLASAAHAQAAGATVGVEGLNNNAPGVGCTYPATTGTAVGPCSVSASASGTTIDNYCREEVAVSAPPVGATVLRDGCSITLSGTLTVIRSTVGNADETAVYNCVGVGLGTLRYTPAPDSPGVGVSGPVVMTYANGVLTAEGVLFGLGPISVGEGSAVLIDPCGPEDLPHLFTAQMNL